MRIPLFDVQTGFGGAEPGVPGQVTLEDLRAEMRRVAIGKALVRITPESLDSDVPLSNRKLYDAVGPCRELFPCPIVVPNTAYDLPFEAEQVQEAIDHGAGAVWIRPQKDAWTLDPWCCDRMFRVLEARRMPVVCLERLVGPSDVGRLAQRFPGLPLILAECNYRAQRVYMPLLETFPNVYLSTGNNNSVYGGIEQVVSRVGAQQLLFGTGFPVTEPMTAITQLMYADIPDEAKVLIGSGNLARLMEGIAR